MPDVITAAETHAERNRRLYGRPRIPRADRRVMLALLAGHRLPGYTLSNLAQVSMGWLYVLLARMGRLGWIDREEVSGRYVYSLTRKGHACVTLLLGLPAQEVPHG